MNASPSQPVSIDPTITTNGEAPRVEGSTAADASQAAEVSASAVSTAPEPRPAAGEKHVPVTEAIRYRKRAQAAEQQLGALQNKLKETEAELQQTRQTVASLERRQKIDALLADAEAVDLEVARLLTESAVELMEEPDVHEAVEELRRSKPYLFRQRSSASAGAMPARRRSNDSASSDEAASTAAATGDRRDLLTYLRLRRNGSRAMSA